MQGDEALHALDAVRDAIADADGRSADEREIEEVADHA